MSTSINRESLLKVLALLRPALSTQDYIPALTHVHFDGEYATAYNDISAISIVSNAPINRCVPGDLFIRALGALSGATVALAYDEAKSTLLLSSGRSKLKLPTLGPKEFPYEAPYGKGDEIAVTKEMLRGIERCLLSVGADPTHPAQMGVTLDTDDAGHAVLFSTDHFTISRYQTKSPIELVGDVPVILPTFFCEQLVSLHKAFPDEKITLSVLSGALLAEFELAAMLFTKSPIDIEPLNFVKVISKYIDKPNAPPGLMKIPDAFDGAFGRALLVLANETDKTTKVSPSPEGRLLLSSTSSMGDADDEIELTAATTLTEFLVDPALVVRASKTCSKMAFYKKTMLLADDDATFLHLIAHCSSIKPT